jgi:hypothetical protein
MAVLMVAPVLNVIGPDTVDLVLCTLDGTFDDNNQANTTQQVVTKSNCSVTVTEGSSVVTYAAGASIGMGASDANDGSVEIYAIKVMLPVDDDTTALSAIDQIVFDGITYQVNRGATIKYTLSGEPDHVRVFATYQAFTAISAELVIVTPRTGRDATGQPTPDGTPRPTTAWCVTPGNTTQRYGIVGDEDEADFTVALSIDDPIQDNDGMLVRGRYGLVRVASQFNRWPDQMARVCTVRTVTGGGAR